MSNKIIQELLKIKPQTSQKLAQAKRQIARKFKISLVGNVELLEGYLEWVAQKKAKLEPSLFSVLGRRKIRTISGVAVVAVFTKPYPCPGRCIYCPFEKNIPKSYLSGEPAIRRAILCNFDPYRQVRMRLLSLEKTGHPRDKVELIIMGGTWSYLRKQYQTWFIKRCFEALNNSSNPIPSLKGGGVGEGVNRIGARVSALAKSGKIPRFESLQRTNETAKHRLTGLTLETRPDWINSGEVKRMRFLGATRVEMGIQALDNSILTLIRRGHGREEAIEATRLLKEAGFKICYHMMPGLPGSRPAKDLAMFKELFTDPDFQPDMLKIYPCLVIQGSELFKWWKQGRYKPYSTKELTELLIKIKQIIPPYVRINRLIRDIPAQSIEAGCKLSNLREVIQEEMEKRGMKCQCIRCREVGHTIIKNSKLKIQNYLAERDPAPQDSLKFKNEKPKLFIRKYPASRGTEYFLSYENKEQTVLYAFLRLRIPSPVSGHLFPVLKDATLIREVHTYGPLVPIGLRLKGTTQHWGLGKKLIREAERISRKLGFKKMAVISGIGAREYYRKLSYRLEDTYMVKKLTGLVKKGRITPRIRCDGYKTI